MSEDLETATESVTEDVEGNAEDPIEEVEHNSNASNVDGNDPENADLETKTLNESTDVGLAEAEAEERSDVADEQTDPVDDETETDLQNEAAERAIEVSVSSSVSSITNGDRKQLLPTDSNRIQEESKNSTSAVQPGASRTETSTHERISSVSVNVSVKEANQPVKQEPANSVSTITQPIPNQLVPLDAVEVKPEEDEIDYDYEHMELPPSLPNLE